MTGNTTRQRPLLLGAVADAIATLLFAVDLKRHGWGREGVLMELVEAKVRSVLTIESGDEITIKTTSCGSEAVRDRSRFDVQPGLAEAHAKSERMVPAHILTGTVAVSSAEPAWRPIDACRRRLTDPRVSTA